jgi:hypothetical protein
MNKKKKKKKKNIICMRILEIDQIWLSKGCSKITDENISL